MDGGLRRLTEATYRARGGTGESLPGAAAVSGRGRVDFRFAIDSDGEPYILTKSDGMIRKVMAVKALALTAATPIGPGPRASQDVTNQELARLTNPVASTPESVAAGKKAYDANCAACHGNLAQGAVKAGISISIIEEQKGKQPPDLTDDQWDHGSNDGEIYAVIKKGLPPTMMAAWDGRIPDTDIWNIVTYLRTLAPTK
jgi:mono/diheme cytochrome c family protein